MFHDSAIDQAEGVGAEAGSTADVDLLEEPDEVAFGDSDDHLPPLNSSLGSVDARHCTPTKSPSETVRFTVATDVLDRVRASRRWGRGRRAGDAVAHREDVRRRELWLRDLRSGTKACR